MFLAVEHDIVLKHPMLSSVCWPQIVTYLCRLDRRAGYNPLWPQFILLSMGLTVQARQLMWGSPDSSLGAVPVSSRNIVIVLFLGFSGDLCIDDTWIYEARFIPLYHCFHFSRFLPDLFPRKLKSLMSQDTPGFARACLAKSRPSDHRCWAEEIGSLSVVVLLPHLVSERQCISYCSVAVIKSIMTKAT